MRWILMNKSNNYKNSKKTTLMNIGNIFTMNSYKRMKIYNRMIVKTFFLSKLIMICNNNNNNNSNNKFKILNNNKMVLLALKN